MCDSQIMLDEIDSAFVIIDDKDELTVDNDKIIQQRKQYLEESKSQEIND